MSAYTDQINANNAIMAQNANAPLAPGMGNYATIQDRLNAGNTYNQALSQYYNQKFPGQAVAFPDNKVVDQLLSSRGIANPATNAYSMNVNPSATSAIASELSPRQQMMQGYQGYVPQKQDVSMGGYSPRSQAISNMISGRVY